MNDKFEIGGIEKSNVTESTDGKCNPAYVLAIHVDKALSSNGYAYVKRPQDMVRLSDDGTYSATFEHGENLKLQIGCTDGYIRDFGSNSDALKMANDKYHEKHKAISDVMRKGSAFESETNDLQMQYE